MRLWHQDLIPYLPNKQLLSQHRECCALRGKGWGKKHATVNYVFRYSLERLFAYHFLIIKEMKKRGYKGVDAIWINPHYRGKQTPPAYNISDFVALTLVNQVEQFKSCLYSEHDNDYFNECCDNLITKLKAKMYNLITNLGFEDSETLKVSQELDKFIVLRISSKKGDKTNE